MSSIVPTSSRPYEIERDGFQLLLKPYGNWTLETVPALDKHLSRDLAAEGFTSADNEFFETEYVVYDFANLEKLDTAGAYVLTRALGCHDGICRTWAVENGKPGQGVLIDTAARANRAMVHQIPHPWYEPLSRLGKGVVHGCNEVYDTLSFFGQFLVKTFQSVLHPSKIRWKSVVALIETVGLDALPIVVILSFFIGAVIAFMGTELLGEFGAKIFVVDLVGIAVLREFAVIITAVIMAGRSNSAFTAQIGSMKMRQEVDAMTVMGLSTEETLVLPRAIACLVSAPILTFAAMLSGLLGGMLVSWTEGISPILYLARLVDDVSVNHFYVGLVKSPFFALIVAIVGCRQGLAVSGSVESLGQRTTQSVVQAIFTIIVVDAIFAMLFLEMGV